MWPCFSQSLHASGRHRWPKHPDLIITTGLNKHYQERKPVSWEEQRETWQTYMAELKGGWKRWKNWGYGILQKATIVLQRELVCMLHMWRGKDSKWWKIQIELHDKIRGAQLIKTEKLANQSLTTKWISKLSHIHWIYNVLQSLYCLI